MKVTVRDRQTLPDIALQTSGSMEAIFDLAMANDVSITDNLIDGQELETVAVVNKKVTDMYAMDDVKPATALSCEDCMASISGIGYMGIEIDFKVS